MVENKKLQEKYLELQLLSLQIKQIEEQLLALDQRAADLIKLRKSLDMLADVKAGNPAWTPISSGIFLPCKLELAKGVLINVGANVIVRKDIPAAKDIVNAQLVQLEDITLKLNDNLKALAQRAQQVELELANTSQDV